MPGVQDFRDSPFARPLIERCGRYLGHSSYWKLYAIENYLRVILHSVLSVQIPPPWWDKAVGPDTKKRVEVVKRGYAKKPFHTSPGRHDIYYVYLPDLNKIMLANSNLFLGLIPDVDVWITRIEDVRIPRNLVGHMNYPNRTDRDRIDKLHAELSGLVARLEKSSLALRIP